MFRPRRPWSVLAAAGVTGALLLRGTVPWWSAAMPGCLVREWTSLHCPGCGGTRCAVKLLEGDFSGALAMNAAVVLIAASAVGVTVAGVWREWRGQAAKGVPPWLVWVLAGFLLVFAATRNLPWWPFTLLAPH